MDWAIMDKSCTGCQVLESQRKGQWWTTIKCSHHPAGFWCPDCYEILSMDGMGEYRHPEEREIFLMELKLSGRVTH